MTFKGLGALSGIAAVAAGFPITATIATIIAIIGFLDLDDELLKYTDSSPETSRGLTKPEEDKTNFKDIGGVKYIKYDVVAPYLDQADAVAEALNEAKKKKKKKDPPLNKPKRGGPKAYYVYVRDPETKKIKKVTKSSYWSCRLPRYASQLGLGANMNTFW